MYISQEAIYIIIYIIGCLISFFITRKLLNIDNMENVKDPICLIIMGPWIILAYIVLAIFSLGSWATLLTLLFFYIIDKIDKKLHKK